MKKKIIYLFNNKTFLCWTRLKREKLLATAKQLIRNNFFCCLKNQDFFYRANIKIGLNSLPLFTFVHFLRTPPPSTTNVLFE